MAYHIYTQRITVEFEVAYSPREAAAMREVVPVSARVTAKLFTESLTGRGWQQVENPHLDALQVTSSAVEGSFDLVAQPKTYYLGFEETFGDALRIAATTCLDSLCEFVADEEGDSLHVAEAKAQARSVLAAAQAGVNTYVVDRVIERRSGYREAVAAFDLG